MYTAVISHFHVGENSVHFKWLCCSYTHTKNINSVSAESFQSINIKVLSIYNDVSRICQQGVLQSKTHLAFGMMIQKSHRL